MKFLSAIFVSLSIIVTPAIASAHVAVTPATVGIGSNHVFTINVPNESQQSMTSLALDIPTGLAEVTPTALAGWTITMTKADDAVTKITWSDSNLLPGQRQEFTFNAQAPAAATKLMWKAYQSFVDGSETSWNQKPNGSDDATGNHGPFSVTSVVNDLTSVQSTKNTNNSLALIIAGMALLLSLYNLLFRKRV